MRTNKDVVTIESEELNVVRPAVRPAVPFRVGKGVTNFLLVPLEGLTSLG